MPSPRFTFRLPQKDKDSLAEVAKLYGAASPGAFLAEMVHAMCGNDLQLVNAFVGRLAERTVAQMRLEFEAKQAAAQPVKGSQGSGAVGEKSTQKRRKGRGRVKEPPSYARRA